MGGYRTRQWLEQIFWGTLTHIFFDLPRVPIGRFMEEGGNLGSHRRFWLAVLISARHAHHRPRPIEMLLTYTAFGGGRLIRHCDFPIRHRATLFGVADGGGQYVRQSFPYK